MPTLGAAAPEHPCPSKGSQESTGPTSGSYEECVSTSPIPIVSLDCDAITDIVAARLAMSFIGHVLFLKSQVPLPIIQLWKVSNTKSSARAIKQRNDLLSSFDTLTSHLTTTFTALSSAFARVRTLTKEEADKNNEKVDQARVYMGVFVGSNAATAKAKAMFAVDGLEVKAIGARDDIVEPEEELEEDEEDDNGSDEDEEDGEDEEDEDSDEDEEDAEEDEEEETDEEESSFLPPESRSPSPELSYPSHAEQQHALQVAERLLARTLAAADAEGNGMSADLPPTQTHILLRAPRRFVHPAWIPRQNISASLESTLDEFLEVSRVRPADPLNQKPKKPQKKGKAVEGVWLVRRGGLNTNVVTKDTALMSDDEWDEMIWWSWDGKIVGFSDW